MTSHGIWTVALTADRVPCSLFFQVSGLYHETSLMLPVMFLLTGARRCFLSGSVFVICVCLCHTVLSISYSFVVTCWEKADLLALLYMMFSCVFVTFPYGVSGQVWYFIVLIPDLCFLLYFVP